MSWGRLRKASQLLFFLAFLALFLWTENSLEPGAFAGVILKLDPYASILSSLAGRQFLIGSALSVLLLVLTFVFGRVWCGWACPLGTTLDWLSFERWRPRSVELPERMRSVKYWILFVSVGGAALGGLSLLVLDPLTIWVRSLHLFVLPALDWTITSLERAIYPQPGFGGIVSTFDKIIRPAVLPSMPLQVRVPWLFAGFFAGIAALNLITPRFWCRYLCPLGALLGICSKAAIIRREVGEACRGCVLCTTACPMGTIDSANGYASDPSECTVCMDCMTACPRDDTHFVPHSWTAPLNGYDPSRRQALISIGAGLGAAGLLRIQAMQPSPHTYAIRPPGAQGDDFLSKCVRCGLCMQVCPTGGLQPAIAEAGLEGLWSPVLVPRLGSCDFGCNRCGQVCPVEAIQPLALEAKRVQIIGKAVINKDRCIVWAEKRDCIVCEEMCPLAEKAVRLEPAEGMVEREDGTELLRPVVIRNRCIGCGICEQKCPIEGEAAIRVVHYDVHQGGETGGVRQGGGGRRAGTDHDE